MPRKKAGTFLVPFFVSFRFGKYGISVRLAAGGAFTPAFRNSIGFPLRGPTPPVLVHAQGPAVPGRPALGRELHSVYHSARRPVKNAVPAPCAKTPPLCKEGRHGEAVAGGLSAFYAKPPWVNVAQRQTGHLTPRIPPRAAPPGISRSSISHRWASVRPARPRSAPPQRPRRCAR